MTALRIDSSWLDDVAGSSSIRYDAFSGGGAEPQSPVDSFLPRKSSASLSNLPPDGAQQDSDIDLEEDQLALDLATAAKQNGDVAFERLDYAKAESMFREALSLMQELPLQTRSGENLLNIHYKLAACAFYLHDQSTAESALVTVVEQPPQSTADALDLCRAGHLLALTYTATEKLDAARSTCNNAYKTRRRLLGKDHEQCYESLALLAYISGEQNQHTRSEIYMSTIPEVHRERLRSSTVSSIRTRQGRPLEPTAFVARPSPSSSVSSIRTRQGRPLEPTAFVARPSPSSSVSSIRTRQGRPLEPTAFVARPSPSSSVSSIRAHQGRPLEPTAPSFVTQVEKNDGNQQSGSSLRRGFKNFVKGYSPVEIMVRNATTNDPFGPTSAELRDIANTTFKSSTDFFNVINMLDKRLNDKRGNWRQVYKSLKVLDYCLREGSELCVDWSRENIETIEELSRHWWVNSNFDKLAGVPGK